MDNKPLTEETVKLRIAQILSQLDEKRLEMALAYVVDVMREEQAARK